MSTPELSVVIPTYARAEQALRAVDSALAQDVDLEVIVVDDGSPEPVVIDRQRVNVLRMPKNAGAAGARNAGVAAAKADWIALLDSDDVWTPSTLRPRLDAARSAGDTARTIWAGAFADVWPDGRRAVRIPKASAHVTDFASGCWMCPGSTALFMREAWQDTGGQDANLRRLEDYDWLLRWAAAGGRLEVHVSVAAEITRGGRASPSSIENAAVYLQGKHAALGGDITRRMKSYLALERATARWHAGDRIGGVRALALSWLLQPRLQAALEPFWR